MTSRRALLAAGTALAALLVVLWLAHALGSSEIPLLRSEGGAQWIKADKPSLHQARLRPMGSVRFRKSFELGAVPERAPLSLRAYRTFRVVVNGVELAVRDDPADWNRTTDHEVAPALAPGANEIVIEVENRRGPPALLAYAPLLGLSSDAGWATSMWERPWQPAALAQRRDPLPITGEFPSPAESLSKSLPLLALLFLVGVLGSRWQALRAVHVRWLLLGAWTLLCLRNLGALPPGVAVPPGIGMDAHDHLEYVAQIAKTGSIPLASDGWQMFQSPLFYLLAAPLYLALEAGRSTDDLLVLLRVLPMLCGLAQIELVWRAARLVLPGRDGLQTVALVVGGLLPINLYSAQVLSNEPLTGVLTAWVVVLAFRMLIDRPLASPLLHSVGLGASFGLALLAKVSPIVLLPLLFAAIAVHTRRQKLGAAGAARLLGGFSVASIAIAGWYYVRNWILLGRPFVGGWEPARGIEWWQDPGYRVPEDLFSFGAALTRPVYASMSGFWDGLYAGLWMDTFLSGMAIASIAPPWRTELVLAMPLLSIPLSVALLVGALRCWRAGTDAGRFAVTAIAFYWAAMAAIFLTVPAYSSIKATYSLGILPCYAVVIARGFEPLGESRIAWPLAMGLLAAWGGASFLGYLI